MCPPVQRVSTDGLGGHVGPPLRSTTAKSAEFLQLACILKGKQYIIAAPSHQTQTPMTASPVAILDLGSSSFHLLITTPGSQQQHQPLFRHKAKVELRAGMNAQGELSTAAQDRALQCLSEFAHWLQHYQVSHVRAVGTFTLRSLDQTGDFLAQAEAALGHPITVVSGEEEARLIYVGAVAQARLKGAIGVIDIGGGSTELIRGQDQTILLAKSLPIGCVSFHQQFFKEGELTETAFRNATTIAAEIIQPLLAELHPHSWTHTIGCSGTLQMISHILKTHQRSYGAINPRGLRWLQQQLLAAKHLDNLQLAGLRSERAHLLPGGLAILMALFDNLRVQTLHLSRGGIREGVLSELLNELDGVSQP